MQCGGCFKRLTKLINEWIWNVLHWKKVNSSEERSRCLHEDAWSLGWLNIAPWRTNEYSVRKKAITKPWRALRWDAASALAFYSRTDWCVPPSRVPNAQKDAAFGVTAMPRYDDLHKPHYWCCHYGCNRRKCGNMETCFWWTLEL